VIALSKLKKAPNAASPTFFCDSDYFSSINIELIDELEEYCKQERKVVRVCMHQSPEDDLHNMVIAHPRDWYVRPHANLAKTKAYHIIRGSMLFVGFDNDQNELFRFTLDEVNPVFRLQKGVFIFIWALSDVCIFHEVAIGPFEREKDTVFASWAPTTEDFDAKDEYIEEVIKGY
jgi:cupin fold WbuC family metalloprotein